MHDLNEALFLNPTFSSVSSFLFAAVGAKRFIIPFTKRYASLKSHKSDPDIEFLNLIFL